MNKLLFIAAFCLPLRHLSLTSGFGYRIHPVTGKYSFHAGIDLRAHADTVFAVIPGFIKSVGFDPFLGVYIRLEKQDIEISFGHLSKIFVLPGDTVSGGDAIGITGATGRVTGGHLHFSVRFNNQYVDPLRFLLAIVQSNQYKKEN